ncbi:serine hydrolase [Myroides odoratimimus]|uniref:serine hydrolase n=1 Tax=Myroides odoratimimus TaxID=76832 RepID=UPI001CE1D57E|nr:serine hydrolase [Myroides odoratimimus]MCA4792656.1 serine hydrolase [Myroides odoratimimus]MCA4819902.1 serine hydrolase [Myroides odoratimimus]MDM1401273.1 serine hydrolase [Myroides odoratimimus]MEC4035752.1 serine hydrolase [Myroides odoratimimus]
MKRLSISIAMCLLMSFGSFAQEKEFKPLIDTFVKDYNTNDYDDIYSHFAPSLKEELPSAKAKLFFVEMKEKLGNIKSMEFYGLDNNQLALFKTEFENNEVALLNLAMNDTGEVVGFRLLDMPKPVDDSFKKFSVEEIIANETVNLPDKGQYAIAIIDDDKVEYHGFKKVGDGVKVENNTDSKFSMANVMTIFTSTVLADAVLEQGVDMTTDINKYYDFSFNKNIKLPFIALANHSSLVPMLPEIKSNDPKVEDDYLTNLTSAQLEDYLQHNLETDTISPDKRQSFSFLGYAILGNTLSKVYNKPFHQLIEEKIFARYGMHNSTVYMPKKKREVVKGINVNLKEVYPVKVGALLPSSGGISTAADLTKFIQAQFNSEDKVLQLTQKPTLIVSPNYWVSLGWKIGYPFGSGEPLYFTRGIDAGYSNYVAFDPVRKKGLIVLSNSSSEGALNGLDSLSYKLVVKLFEDK